MNLQDNGRYSDLDLIFKKYGDWWCRERGGRCDRMNMVQSGYEEKRLVLSDMRIEYYDDPNTLMVPQTGAQQILTNNTSLEQSQTVVLSKTTTSTFTWQLTEGFKIGMKAEFAVGVPPIVSAKTEISGELNFSSTQTSTKTEQKSWQVTQAVKVPPKSEVEATLLIDENKFSQRFHSRCTLSGYVCSNSPDRIDGHYFWFHPIAAIFARFPQRGFTVKGDVVLYEGDGKFDGMMGVRTRLDLQERALGDKTKVLRQYSIAQSLDGAGIVGIDDVALVNP